MPTISEIPKLLDLDSQEILRLIKNINDLYQVVWRLYLECYRKSLDFLMEEDFMKEFTSYPINTSLLPLNCLMIWRGQYMTETVTDYTKIDRVRKFLYILGKLVNDLRARESGLKPGIIYIPRSNDYNQILFTSTSQMEEFVEVAGDFIAELRKSFNNSYHRVTWK